MTSRVPVCALLFVIVAVTAGCSGAVEGWLRRRTYPPSFHYVSEAQLKSSMWLLGHQSLELRRLMLLAAGPEQYPRSQIVLLLADMAQTVRQLHPEASNHPGLAQGLEALAADLEAARKAVEHEPPSYYLAGSASGACLYCHGS
ncbi:MAG: hypothetical protein HYY35_05270 [Deltaproteobacteria bacterium]|nr:hypothetical protein [Deltaproteobacteria bacterium]